MNKTGIYKITNKLNNNSYIGQSVDIFKRWLAHINPKKSPDMIISKAIMKHGVENFTFEVLEFCKSEDLNALEKNWIARYDTYKNGYNATSGGDSRDYKLGKLTEEKVTKIRELLHESKYTKSEIADMFNVTEGTIRAVNTGDSWYNSKIIYPISVGLPKNKEVTRTVVNNRLVTTPKKDIRCISCGKVLKASTKTGKCKYCQAIASRKVTRPNRYELLGLSMTHTLTAMAEKFTISDVAIKKWCKKYNIPGGKSKFKKLKWSAYPDSNREQILRRDLVYPVNL